ncbi:MAG: hypothetical protein ABIO60_10535 [Aquaticitalea sp.]
MVSDNIEKLLEKYDNSETTLQEEEQLRAYFSQDDVALHLESYRVMFQYFANTKQETFTKKVPLQAKKRSYIYQWIAVAAVIVVMFGFFTQFSGKEQKSFDDLTDEQLMAYNHTKEAFDMLSTKFNQGASNVSVLGVVGTQFDKGVEKVNYVKVFSQTTNKILKKPIKNK